VPEGLSPGGRAPDDEPSVDFALVADAIQVSGDRLHVLGAGWETLAAHGFPTSIHSLSVGMKLRVPWTRANRRFELEIDLEDEDGFSVLGDETVRQPFELGRPAGVLPGSDLTVVWAYAFNHLELPRPGSYSFVIRIDGHVARRTRFRAAPHVH
jgi:hypothetical protein